MSAATENRDATTTGSAINEEAKSMNAPAARFHRRRAALLASLAAAALLLAAFGSAPASAEFGLEEFDVTATEADGSVATQAGSHPFALDTVLFVNRAGGRPDGELKDLRVEMPAGLVGDTTAYPTCSMVDFLTDPPGTTPFDGKTQCNETETAVGILGTWIFPLVASLPVLNLEPPAGVPARVGFNVSGAHVVVDLRPKQEPEYNIFGEQKNTVQILAVLAADLRLWGVPGDPAHDELRGVCGINGYLAFSAAEVDFEFTHGSFGESCPSNNGEKPFLTLPTECRGPQPVSWEAVSWQEPGNLISGSLLTHDFAEPPNPLGYTGCGKLPFDPRVEVSPTTEAAETGSGLDFDLDFQDEGLTNADGLAQSHVKKAVATLPEGVTINPSIGEGLGVCTPADLERETIDSIPGEGCPNASKIGTLQAELPILGEPIDGQIYLAEQDDPATSEPGAENPFDSLIALYFVLKNPTLGALAKLPVLVEPDPQTGQLRVTLDDGPRFPIGHFNAHMRSGVRAPLVTPATCGSHTTVTELYPYSDPDNPRTVRSSFEITGGVAGGPCPPGGTPPFEPGFEAGSVNNNAGSFSPFVMRLLRRDGDQDMTKFSSVLPPGVVGSLAGIEKCPDAAVGIAKAKTGRAEQASPSCPANSEIGNTLAGAGVGSTLTYVPGKIYLAGPYKGAPLSVVSITPAIAGPFDAGTVAVRLGLDLNPVTAEVEVDGAASDPIPHILQGIVLKLRDLRVHVDRPNFTLNPTSCDESSARATLFGSNLNVFDPADDVPVDLATRYQAANCLNLGFAPKLGLKLKGGTRRGNFPGLKSHYKPTPGHANLKDLVVRLPRSAFLEQGHIRTICTRVQFAADNCPKAAQYGYIRAWTPLLDEPLQGPVYLRSSSHKLPDLVFDLHGLVDVEVQTRIDSVKGGIRARVENAPDAPISRVILNMQGGKKGLIVNSRNLCTKKKARANVKGTGQNGKQFTRRPVLRPQCGRKAKRSSHSRVSRVARASKAG